MKKALHFSGQHRALRSFLALSIMLLAFMAMPIIGWGQTTETTYNFSEINGFSEWGNSYSEHIVEYDDATITFSLASRQTSTITNIPVTKGQPVSLVLNQPEYSITSVTFVCQQWGSKAQTITLKYSTDGGTTYTATNTTSSNFTISHSTLPAGTNAVQITFSSTSNQVGIESCSYTLASNNGSTGDNTQWVLTNLADLTTSDVFVIVGNNGNNYAMSNNNGTGNAPKAVAITVNNNTLSGNIADSIQWNISGNATNGYTFYPNGSTTTWLYCNSTNNGVRVGTNTNKIFSVDDGYLKHNNTSRYVGIYNSQDWRCYTSSGGNIANQTFAFYKKVEITPTITVEPLNLVLDMEDQEGTLPITYTNLQLDETHVLDLIPCDANGDFLGANDDLPNWINADVNQPGQNGDYRMYYHALQSNGGTRSAYYKVAYTSVDPIDPTIEPQIIATSDLITIIQTAPDYISDITVTGTYFVKGTIVAKSTRGFIVGDGTGYAYYYNKNYTQSDYNIGDMVKLSGSVIAYGGVFEFDTNTIITPATESNYQEENPTVITGSEMDTRVGSSNNQLPSYIQYQGILTVGDGQHYNITDIDGATTAIGSISYPTNTDFTLLAGNTVIIKGYFVGVSTSTYYNTMLGSIEVKPSVSVSPTTINAPATAADGSLTVTYENISDIIAEVYFCNAEGTAATYDWITANIDNDNNVEYLIDANTGAARTAYLKVYALDDNAEDVYSNLVTINQEEYVAPTYAALPFSFNDGRNSIENTDGLYQEGLGTDYNATSNPYTQLKFDNTDDWLLLQFTESPDSLTFDIKGNSFSGGTFKVQTSEDGNTYTDLKTYTELGDTQHEGFDNIGANVRYIKWIYTDKINGNVGLGNISVTANIPAINISSYSVGAPAEGTDGSLTVTYENISDIIAEVYFCNADGTAATYDWITADIDNDNNVEYLIDANTGAARTAYLKVYALDDNAEDVYSDLVTITQEAFVATSDYRLFSGDLVEGDYIIYYDGNAMNTTVSSNRLQYEEVTPINDIISTNKASIVWHIAPSGEYWTLYNVAANAYAASTGAKNKAQMLADGTDDKALWTISGTETYEFVNKANAAANVNANLRNNGTYGFACYATGTGGALSLYKKIQTYPVELLDVTNGTITASPMSDTIGATITLTATPNEGYHFNGWEVTTITTPAPEAVTVTNNSFLMPEGGAYVSATFEMNTYTVATTANPTEGGTVTGADTYNHGETATLIATPVDGYFFINWTDGGTVVSTSATYTFSVTDNKNLVANFSETLSCPTIEYDGYTYTSVQIGSKCWMNENLRTTHYADGRPITNVYQYNSPEYPNVTENVNTYGLLYDWYDALDSNIVRTRSVHKQGICPNGWHIPTETEFAELTATDIQTVRSTNYWLSNPGNNSTGFDMRPAGMYNYMNERYENLRGNTYFWVADDVNTTEAHCHMADCNCYMIYDLISKKSHGYSVRCIKD